MKNKFENEKEGGFLKLILFIVIAIFLMKYFHITVSSIIDWLKSVF